MISVEINVRKHVKALIETQTPRKMWKKGPVYSSMPIYSTLKRKEVSPEACLIIII